MNEKEHTLKGKAYPVTIRSLTLRLVIKILVTFFLFINLVVVMITKMFPVKEKNKKLSYLAVICIL